MEQFLTYFPSAFSWGNLALLILGSAGGLFFGAMPGLSPTMAVALLVPFTFYLPADTSLILLGAVYTSAVAGGSISAILLSIPGAPSSIATLFDGYPMAKQGRAQEALYTVFVSSLIGGVFGVLVMILFSPPMAEFAMRFGPSELFWTAIFGITVITGLSSGAMLKGLFGGALGMLLSTVGYSTLTGEPRFVIHEALNGGIALVPALIGLFAVPQIIDLMADSHVLLEKLTFKPQKGMLRQVTRHIGATCARWASAASSAPSSASSPERAGKSPGSCPMTRPRSSTRIPIGSEPAIRKASALRKARTTPQSPPP